MTSRDSASGLAGLRSQLAGAWAWCALACHPPLPTVPRQMDLFADADPADLLLPRRPLLSVEDVSRAAGQSVKRVRRAAAAGDLDAIRLVGRFKLYVPRPAAIAYLRAAGIL